MKFKIRKIKVSLKIKLIKSVKLINKLVNIFYPHKRTNPSTKSTYRKPRNAKSKNKTT